jgi:uncharacterized protein YndB with AHSA1/START domain
MPMPSDAATVPTVKIRRVIASPAQKIFDLWTRPELMARWMSPFPGAVHCDVVADVRVGGTFRLSMSSADSQCEIEGTYVQIERPNRLVFTWFGPPTQNANTLVTVELKALQTGTELTLTHEKLPTAEVRQGHTTGWEYMFDHLLVEVG